MLTVGALPASITCHRHTPCRSPRYHPQSPIAAVFFRQSRLFFREATFFSGGEGCEWRASRATVGRRVGIQRRKHVFGLIPIRRLTKGRSPHISASRLFILFHPTMPHQNPHPSKPHNPTIPSKKRNIPYWYCLQCTPSLILPPSSLIS